MRTVNKNLLCKVEINFIQFRQTPCYVISGNMTIRSGCKVFKRWNYIRLICFKTFHIIIIETRENMVRVFSMYNIIPEQSTS